MAVPTNAHWDFGALLWVELGSYGSESWAEVAGVERISPPQRERDEHEVTNHSSPRFSEEVIATLIRNGMAELTLIYDAYDDDHNRFIRDFSETRNARKRRYQIHFADGQGVLHFTAFVKKEPFQEQAKDGAIRMQVTLRLMQGSNFIPGASS